MPLPWRRLLDGSVLVAALGLVFVVGGVVLWSQELAPTSTSLQEMLFELTIHVLFGGVILVVGIHLERSELRAEDRRSVMIWCFGGFTFLLGLSVWGNLSEILTGELTLAFASDFVVFASLGGAFGAIAGVNWGRANRNHKLAEEIREHRETLALLTRLISHDIRNDMMIVQGHADILRDHVEAEGTANLEIIRERLNTTVNLLEDTMTLVQTLGKERTFEVIHLSAVLEEELDAIEESYPEVELRKDIPLDLMVVADDLISQLFSNLFKNAVFHNDPDDLVISVTAAHADEDIEVVVSDNGTGIPEEDRDRVFELGEQGPESDGDGIGLYLVSRLADVYGGSVDLEDSPEGGAQFRITFPTPAAED